MGLASRAYARTSIPGVTPRNARGRRELALVVSTAAWKALGVLQINFDRSNLTSTEYPASQLHQSASYRLPRDMYYSRLHHVNLNPSPVHVSRKVSNLLELSGKLIVLS